MKKKAQLFSSLISTIFNSTHACSAYDSYYKKAQQIRRLVCQDFEKVFADGVDALLTPTTPSPAFLISEVNQLDPVQLYINDVMTIPASLAGKKGYVYDCAGLPAISVPIKLSKEGLPLGLQLIGKSMWEGELLNIATAIESKEFHTFIPSLLQNKI